jgi:DMSO/TMAO reductase YedYZ molybdopterin-dependent catalytic subunit
MSILKDLGVPVFKAGGIPTIDLHTYMLFVEGQVEKPYRFSWQEILAMPKSRVNSRLTSVSGWSVRAEARRPIKGREVTEF